MPHGGASPAHVAVSARSVAVVDPPNISGCMPWCLTPAHQDAVKGASLLHIRMQGRGTLPQSTHCSFGGDAGVATHGALWLQACPPARCAPGCTAQWLPSRGWLPSAWVAGLHPTPLMRLQPHKGRAVNACQGHCPAPSQAGLLCLCPLCPLCLLCTALRVLCRQLVTVGSEGWWGASSHPELLTPCTNGCDWVLDCKTSNMDFACIHL